MKKTLIIIAVLFATATQAQKQDSLVLHIEMDTTTFKSIVQLIQENIPSNTLTGKMVLQNILQPFYQAAKLEPKSKPKEIVTPKKN